MLIDISGTEDGAAVIAQTDRWLRCSIDRTAGRLEDILADDFRYTSDPKAGVAEMDKAAMVAVNAQLDDSGSDKLDHKVYRVGDTILSLTLTRSNEQMVGDLGGVASADAMNNGLMGNLLIYVSGWRQEAGTWRCFNMHLVDAVKPS